MMHPIYPKLAVFICIASAHAVPAAKAQCCEKSAAPAKPSHSVMAEGKGTAETKSDAAVKAEWLVLAARRVADEASRLMEKFTYSEYSTQWSSWCAGNRGGAPQPCAPKCCAKAEQRKPANDTKCCRQPCPAQGTRTMNGS